MRKTALAPLLTLVALSACGEPPVRFAVPPVETAARVPISFASVELRDVTLPSYAQLEEIFVETPEGALRGFPDLLWADAPVRAATLELAGGLRQITGARVASEPWPFDSFPDVRVEVRIEEMIASQTGAFRLSGQYFVAALDASGRERASVFQLSVPLPPEAGPVAIAAARSAAMAQLAEVIAREGLG